MKKRLKKQRRTKIDSSLMIFGQPSDTSSFDIAEAERQIRKLILRPANSAYLQSALEHQKELKLYISGDSRYKKMILDIAKNRMVKQQYDVFNREFRFRTKSICDTIIKHFYNVFEAHGRVYNFDFNNDAESELRFNEVRKTLFKISDEEYFEKYAHRFAFTEPNAVIVSGRDEERFVSQKFGLEQIHDVAADEAGINYIIICVEIKDEETTRKYYYVYDDVRRYRYHKTNESTILEEVIEHGAKKCPVAFVSNINRSEENNIEKSSPISAVIDDGKMQDLFINSITMSYYKASSAFDTKVRPEDAPRQEFKNEIHASDKLEDDAKYVKALGDTKSRNPEMMGHVIEIPYAKMFKADFVGSVLSAVQNIAANTDVLQYHDTYLANLEKDILATVLGRGVGDALRSSALNEDQVAANFEEQERALDMYSSNIESTWNYVLTRTAEIFSQSFNSLKLKLGDKYFLKSEEQLLNELDMMQKSFSNSAQIMQKQFEIYLLKNRANKKALERYNLIAVLQPFSYKTQDWVMSNRETLNPSMVQMYNYFEQVIGMFEFVNGRIENFGTEIESRQRRLEVISKEFYSILNQIISDGNNIEDTTANTIEE